MLPLRLALAGSLSIALPAAPAEEPEKPAGPMSADTFAGLKLRSLGPAVTSGRIVSIAVDPKDKSTYYIGSASGGVWKTINTGTSWTPVGVGRHWREQQPA